jgi:hypothetical protein
MMPLKKAIRSSKRQESTLGDKKQANARAVYEMLYPFKFIIH